MCILISSHRDSYPAHPAARALWVESDAGRSLDVLLHPAGSLSRGRSINDPERGHSAAFAEKAYKRLLILDLRRLGISGSSARRTKPYYDSEWPGLNAQRAKATVTRFEQIGDDPGTPIPCVDDLTGQIISPGLTSSWSRSVRNDLWGADIRAANNLGDEAPRHERGWFAISASRTTRGVGTPHPLAWWRRARHRNLLPWNARSPFSFRYGPTAHPAISGRNEYILSGLHDFGKPGTAAPSHPISRGDCVWSMISRPSISRPSRLSTSGGFCLFSAGLSARRRIT